MSCRGLAIVRSINEMEAQITISNDCSVSKISSDCKPILRAATDSYRRNLDKLLLSVRLLGSIPRGEGTVGASDIDFVALVSASPDAHQREAVAADAKKLTLSHQCVSSVDMETEIKGRVPPVRELIFRTDSILIWGDDDYSATEATVPVVTLARLCTPDYSKLMAGYRQQLKNSMNDDGLRRFGRLVGKDLLKCFRKHLILHRGVYRKSPQEIHSQLVMYFPDQSETFNCLLRIYERPVERKDELLQIVKMVQLSWEALEKGSA
jgi:hypothetical protein